MTFARNGIIYERQYARLQEKLGHHCERIAGSGARTNAVCDLVLFRQWKVYLVEIKSTKEKVFYISARIHSQLRKLQQIALAHSATPLLAIRFKYHGWKEIDLSKGVPAKVLFDSQQ